MKITLYKPNSNNTGAAFGFESTYDKQGKPSLFVSMIQQHSWNDQTKNGSFKENAKNPDKSGTIKLSDIEAGEFISSFRSRKPFTAFHKTSENTTIINLTPWDKKRKTRGKDGEDIWSEVPAWGLNINQNSSQNFRIPIEAGESVTLEVLFNAFIQNCLTYNSEAYKKDGNGSGNGSGGSNPAPKSSPPNNPPSGNDSDDDIPF